MKASNGQLVLDIDRQKNNFEVKLTSNQYVQADYEKLIPDINVVEKDDQLILTYLIPEKAISLATLSRQNGSMLKKLKLAQKLAELVNLNNRFNVPFLHPANVMFDGERVFVVHFGLSGIFEPNAMDNDSFFKLYRALILSIFNTNNEFDTLFSGMSTNQNPLYKKINGTQNLNELLKLINDEADAEANRVSAKEMMVRKTHYRFFKYFGIFAIISALVMIGFTYSFYGQTQKQDAVISAQTAFLTKDYAQAQSDLKSYSPKSLPKSARYVLAASSVNLTDLTSSQKQSILNNISTKSDNNTLDYWINTGRGKFSAALNLAQNLGDSQLTLLAYTNLYESTKLDSTMNGEQKQQRLSDYNKKIKELTKQLEK